MYLTGVLSAQVHHPCVRKSRVTFVKSCCQKQHCMKLVVLRHCSDDPGASSDPGTQPSNPGLAGECRE